jgi:hypothetical protein
VERSELADRLDAIADEIADLALEQLRELAHRARGLPVERADLAVERRLTRARRAVEKAADLLRVEDPSDEREGVDGLDTLEPG